MRENLKFEVSFSVGTPIKESHTKNGKNPLFICLHGLSPLHHATPALGDLSIEMVQIDSSLLPTKDLIFCKGLARDLEC